MSRPGVQQPRRGHREEDRGTDLEAGRPQEQDRGGGKEKGTGDQPQLPQPRRRGRLHRRDDQSLDGKG